MDLVICTTRTFFSYPLYGSPDFSCVMAILGSITALKKSKERFENEMAELGSSRDMSGRESEAAGRIVGLKKKIQYVTTDRVCQFFTSER